MFVAVFLRCLASWSRRRRESEPRQIVKIHRFLLGNQYVRLFARRLKTQTAVANFKRNRAEQTTRNKHSSNTKHHQKSIKKCSKIAPWRGCWGVPGRLGELLGTRSAPRGSRNQLWRPPGAPKTRPGPDTPRSEKLLDFRVPGWYPETLGRAPGRCF